MQRCNRPCRVHGLDYNLVSLGRISRGKLVESYYELWMYANSPRTRVRRNADEGKFIRNWAKVQMKLYDMHSQIQRDNLWNPQARIVVPEP